MKYLGLDYGSKTLGLSISDELGIFATPYKTLFYKNNEELINELKKIIILENIGELVLGNPLNLDGSLSDRSKETLLYKKELEDELKIKINLWDERLSTVEASRILRENNTKRKKKKELIDTVAAVIILQGFLDRKDSYGK